MRCVKILAALIASAVCFHAWADESSGSGEDPRLEFYGLIQFYPQDGSPGDWQIAGRSVRVTAFTQIRPQDARPSLGVCAEVKGRALADSSVDATEIQIKPSADCGAGGLYRDEWIEMDAFVEKVPSGALLGDWQIGGRVVRVLSGTVIRQNSTPAGAGVCAQVKGRSLADNSIEAASLELGSGSASCGAPGSPPNASLNLWGVIQKLPELELTGDWQVSGRTVHVLSSTILHEERGLMIVGACVEVKGEPLSDGSVDALEIELKTISTPCVSPRGIVNAASFTSGRVSPGELISIFGFGIGPAASAPMQMGEDRRVSAALGNTQVRFDGVPAPLILAGMTQINAVVPFSVEGKPKTTVQVEFAGMLSNPVVLPVVEANPALFTLFSSGRGQGAILNQDGSVNSAANPAARGSTIVLYATGAGVPSRKVEDGEVIQDDRTNPLLPVSVRIGGREAEVLWAGAAPGYVAGVWQVNARVPADVAPGDAVPIELKVRHAASQPGVTMAVR